MKKLIWTIVGVLTLNTSIMAQKEFEIENEIVVNVSAEELWEMIGPGFIEVYKWSSNVDHAVGSGESEFEGAVCTDRKCDVNIKGFSSVSENLYKYDQTNMVLAYAVTEGMPGFVTKAINEWSVIPLGNNRSKLVMKAQMGTKGLMGSLMGGMMKKKMGETLVTILNDAKVYAETGEQSEAKKARVEQLAKKQKKAA